MKKPSDHCRRHRARAASRQLVLPHCPVSFPRRHNWWSVLLYTVCAFVAAIAVAWYLITLPRRRESELGLTLLYLSAGQRPKGRPISATTQNAIVLGYDVHGKAWLWPDATRVMQAVGIRGDWFGQDNTAQEHHHPGSLSCRWSGRSDRRRMPMLIFDGKGDQEFLSDLLPAIETAGRMHQLRVLDPSRPDISVRYNPFFSEHGLYQEHADFVFESFDLEEDFFHGHQATYLSDLSRVLAHTGKRFNIHDVLVMALDRKGPAGTDRDRPQPAFRRRQA